MPVTYLVAAEIVAINQIVIELSGGKHGVREPRLLESIALKPSVSYAGNDLYPDIFLKAGVLYEALVNYHVFLDGNKRTGLAAMARFLYLNGYTLQLTDAEMVTYTVKVATEKPDMAEIAVWIKGHARTKDRRT